MATGSYNQCRQKEDATTTKLGIFPQNLKCARAKSIFNIDNIFMNFLDYFYLFNIQFCWFVKSFQAAR